jgi:hypothetical protein
LVFLAIEICLNFYLICSIVFVKLHLKSDPHFLNEAVFFKSIKYIEKFINCLRVKKIHNMLHGCEKNTFKKFKGKVVGGAVARHQQLSFTI